MTIPCYAYAHSGGLDGLGGHNVRTAGHGFDVGTYHYHKGTFAGWIVNAKGEAPSGNSIFNPALITDSVSTANLSSWATTEIQLAYKAGLLKGVKNRLSEKFKTAITREDFCKVLVTCIQLQDPNFSSKFVKNNNTFEDLDIYKFEINVAYKLGIVKGYDDKKFNPKKSITREEIAVMLYRYLKRFSTLNLNVNTATIADANLISSWADKEVRALVSLDIIKGIGLGSEVVFDPKSNTTVEQAIILIFRIK